MSFSALLCAQSFAVRHWDTATVDKILIKGDRMYLSALESQSIPDTDTLSLMYLPNQARSSGQFNRPPLRSQNKINRPLRSLYNKIAFWGKEFFILLQLCFKNVSSVWIFTTLPFKREYWPHCDYIFTCILKWKGDFYFQMYLVFSYLKENTHLSITTFVHIVFRKTLILRFVSVTLLLHD